MGGSAVPYLMRGKMKLPSSSLNTPAVFFGLSKLPIEKEERTFPLSKCIAAPMELRERATLCN
jgi:hypothetical protein